MPETIKTQLVVFLLEHKEYGLSIDQVREIIYLSEVTPLPLENSSIEGVINLRGQIIPIINLKRRLGLVNQTYSSKARVIVAELEKQLLGLKIDDAVEVLHLDSDAIKALSDILSQAESQNLVAGVGKLEDRLIVLLDLTKLFNNQEMQEIQKEAAEAKLELQLLGEERGK